MRPIIGLTVALDAERAATSPGAYSHAIELAGGVPVLLPYAKEADTLAAYLSLCDGFFFTGGADVDPARYGERALPECGTLQQNRDALEFPLLEQILKTGKPLLGVCRGAQLINVALGGTLYQDIPTQCPSTIAHRQLEGKFEYSHAVTVLPQTPLSALVGAGNMAANSFHHQAVKAPGEGLAVMAHAEDGVIEALYHTAHPYLRLYQWHPERLCDKDARSCAIFADFISACTAKELNCPEEMAAFFAARVSGYDAHMLTEVEGCREGYAKMAELIPPHTKRLLDLGCGTGLELDAIFEKLPTLDITGIDLCPEMLHALAQKHADKHPTLICGDYFTADFGTKPFDIAISFETMHHFPPAQKLTLYRKICAALPPSGAYIECDYMVRTQAEQTLHFVKADAIRMAKKLADGGFYHIDTPCCVQTQLELLHKAGFATVREVFAKGGTVMLVAEK